MDNDKPLLILQELFTDPGFVFRVHNVKLATVDSSYDLPQMFLAHYDSLADDIKADLPLTLDTAQKNQHPCARR